MHEGFYIDSSYYMPVEIWQKMIDNMQIVANELNQEINFYYISQSGEKLLIEQFKPSDHVRPTVK